MTKDAIKKYLCENHPDASPKDVMDFIMLLPNSVEEFDFSTVKYAEEMTFGKSSDGDDYVISDYFIDAEYTEAIKLTGNKLHVDGINYIVSDSVPLQVCSETLKIVGSGILVLFAGPKQACIGTPVEINNTTGFWSKPTGPILEEIEVDGVTVICLSQVPDFSLGAYGSLFVPRVNLVNGGKLICPEMRGTRTRIVSGFEGCSEYESTTHADAQYYIEERFEAFGQAKVSPEAYDKFREAKVSLERFLSQKLSAVDMKLIENGYNALYNDICFSDYVTAAKDYSPYDKFVKELISLPIFTSGELSAMISKKFVVENITVDMAVKGMLDGLHIGSHVPFLVRQLFGVNSDKNLELLELDKEQLELRDKIFNLMKAIDVDISDFTFDKRSNTVLGFEDDQWSGKSIHYGVDKFGNLFHNVYDDSPEQAGGWTQSEFYCNGECYCTSNIADRYIYFPYKGKWYAAELEYTFNELYIYELLPSTSCGTQEYLYRGSCMKNNPLIATTEDFESYCCSLLSDLV